MPIEFRQSKYHHVDNGGLTFTVQADEHCNVDVEINVSRYESETTFPFNLPQIRDFDALAQLEMMRDVLNDAIRFASGRKATNDLLARAASS